MIINNLITSLSIILNLNIWKDFTLPNFLLIIFKIVKIFYYFTLNNISMNNIVLIPTDEAETGMIGKDARNNLEVYGSHTAGSANINRYDFKPQHLHVLSDDIITEGDWCCSIDRKSKLHKPFKCISKQPFINPEFLNSECCKDIKKVIATTDRLLGIELIFDAFIDYYVEQHNENETTISEVNYEILKSFYQFLID